MSTSGSLTVEIASSGRAPAGDYLELVEFTSDQVHEAIQRAGELVDTLEELLETAET